MAVYTLPDLDYDYSALAPHISGEIMELHHSKHHAAYVAGANQALEQLAEAREDGSIGAQFLATGSPGGSEITSYVVKNLVAMLDWGMDPQSAADLRNFGAISRSEAVVETGWGSTDGSTGDDLVDALDGPGPDPKESTMPSGTATILRHDGVLVGGADPRREGEVRGG